MIKGGCLCGKIRYEFKQEDVISAGNCHCKDCQKATGSGKATIVYIPSKSLKINDDYKIYSVIGQLRNIFCNHHLFSNFLMECKQL